MPGKQNHPNTALHELHLSDDAIDVLKTWNFNHRLLPEMICHKDFQTLMPDAEIYVDRIADMRIHNMNAVLEAVRHMNSPIAAVDSFAESVHKLFTFICAKDIAFSLIV